LRDFLRSHAGYDSFVRQDNGLWYYSEKYFLDVTSISGCHWRIAAAGEIKKFGPDDKYPYAYSSNQRAPEWYIDVDLSDIDQNIIAVSDSYRRKEFSVTAKSRAGRTVVTSFIESHTISRDSTFSLDFQEKDSAERAAKAFRRAVFLCQDKKLSPF